MQGRNHLLVKHLKSHHQRKLIVKLIKTHLYDKHELSISRPPKRAAKG